MNKLFVDCFSGISGDMLLGAFLDLGWPLKRLYALSKMLPIKQVKIEVTRVKRCSISANLVQISSYSNEPLRNIKDILTIIDKSQLSADIKEKAKKIFFTLAEAEAKIHGISLDDVHFHEVGAVDTIIDIVGSVVALKDLGIDEVYSSPVSVCRGFVDCSHGILPLPAPAAIEILKEVPLKFIHGEHELVTPTGAAILKNIVKHWTLPNELLVSKIGYGAGKREDGRIPNILRIFLFSEKDHQKQDVVEVKTVIDDMPSEHLGYLFELFVKKGALDLWLTPIVMKKNRPGFELTVLCTQDQLPSIESLVFSHTTTIGIRIYGAKRHILKRKEAFLDTRWGKIRAKEIIRPNGKHEIVPEFEECRKVAQKYELPLRVIYDEIKAISLARDDK